MVAQTYVKQIVRKVKCSRQKRAEIGKQLLSDVDMAMSQGESLEKVMLRMGEPIAVAEEFNQNLPDYERRKYKRGILVKIMLAVAIVLAGLVLAAVWFLPWTSQFGSSGIFQEKAIEEKSKEVIRLLDAGDYQALREASDIHMQDFLNPGVLEPAKNQAGADWGEFLDFGKVYMSEIKQRGEHSAIVQINAAYENIGVTYTLFFNEDMELSGLYIK